MNTIQIKTIINRLKSEHSIKINYRTSSISKQDENACWNFIRGFTSRADLYYIIIADYAHLVLRVNEKWAVKYNKRFEELKDFKKDISIFLSTLGIN